MRADLELPPTPIETLAAAAACTAAQAAAILQRGRVLVRAQRRAARARWIDCLLHEYGIGNAEGLALLTLAEAYLRVPDAASAGQLLAEKLQAGNWRAHRGRSPSWRVNALTRALMLARASLSPRAAAALRPLVALLLQRLGREFVFGADIHAALRRAAGRAADSYSFDMLGEAARTQAQAESYFEAYAQAIRVVGARARGGVASTVNDGVSVKLSALECRYEPLQAQRVLPALTRRVLSLAEAARAANIGLTIDAEEHARLGMSLAVIEALAAAPQLRDWDGLGFAIQAYQRRAPALIAWAGALARRTHRRLTVRLVKGAYWDVEIKRAQELGLPDYPVHTRKCATDVSFLACARALLADDALHPAFATHNAQSVATLLQWAGARRDFEFQRLHGMGLGLYGPLPGCEPVRCRIYAPVGAYAQLLPYLVRRMLENGANAGFVYQLGQPGTGEEQLLRDPCARLADPPGAKEVIVMPAQLFADRRNSGGIDLGDGLALAALQARLGRLAEVPASAAPLIGGRSPDRPARPVFGPAARGAVIGRVIETTPEDVVAAYALARRAQPAWESAGVEARAQCLERAADLLERERDALMSLAIREAGKSIPDALAEVREAVDFCRYYAQQARRLLAPVRLPGPTGELNEWRWAPRGVFACISPWNFPLAIFMGQVAAALVTGNAVLAKPAPQTPLMGARAVGLLLEAGVPGEVIACLPGADAVGAALIADSRLAGVAFTGSNDTARRIAAALLANESRGLVPLLAETGGLNAMIVDSTALPERVVGDVIASAFQSAGQRCSALRLLCLQQEAAPVLLPMLIGAMATLRVGDPAHPDTDVGPVIDAAARARIEAYLGELEATALLCRTPLPATLPDGYFVAPALVRLERIEALRAEIFGPVLHVVTWPAGGLEATLEQINASGYGLTLGLQTRLAGAVERVRARARVGNLYVNRPMIGAVVGSQPFGGEGLSGTGPKAGGPNYLARFMTERAVSIDLTAAGGNVELLGGEG